MKYEGNFRIISRFRQVKIGSHIYIMSLQTEKQPMCLIKNYYDLRHTVAACVSV